MKFNILGGVKLWNTIGSSELKLDGIKEVKIWKHKGIQLWWKSWRLSSSIGRKCNNCIDWTSLFCLTGSSKLGVDIGFKEGSSFGVPECYVDSRI